MADNYRPVRCKKCKTLLLEVDITEGSVRKICPKCKTVNEVKVTQTAIPAVPFQERMNMRFK